MLKNRSMEIAYGVLLTYDMDKRHSEYKAQLEASRIANAGKE